MPAEWEPHRATWIAWPHEKRDWPGKLAPIPWVYAEFVRHLTRAPLSLQSATGRPREVCAILVADEATEQRARRVLERAHADLDQVEFHRVATDRSWLRDSGPLFVRRATGEVAATLWHFNGWAKYPNHLLDQHVSRAIADARPGMRRFDKLSYKTGGKTDHGTERHVVLEGGSLDVNGLGTLLTTEECLLSEVQARNPGWSRERLEAMFAERLGATHVVWLKNGIAGDDTHGHVDDLARFVGPRTVALVEEPDADDANHAALVENRRILERATDQDGQPLTVLPLPMPAPLYCDGVRLPASYANFYIGNHAVLVPTFNDANDRVALDRIARCFPDRATVGIHAVDLVWGLGTLHCMTQQEPLDTSR